jgi:hypothetical protein
MGMVCEKSWILVTSVCSKLRLLSEVIDLGRLCVCTHNINNTSYNNNGSGSSYTGNTLSNGSLAKALHRSCMQIGLLAQKVSLR